MEKELKCHCGDTTFSLHLYTLDQVGLLTCSHGHHSLLLDSHIIWRDVVQGNRKPRKLHCKCKASSFRVSLLYSFWEDNEVSQVDILTTCINCGDERRAMYIEIDYGPTRQLIDRPLTPCEAPWLKTRQVQLSYLWGINDIKSFTNWVMGLASVRARLIAVDGSIYLINDGNELQHKVETEPGWDLFLSDERASSPDELSVKWWRWQDIPVIHIWGPRVIVDNAGNTISTMYYMEYAEQVVQNLAVVPQPRVFLQLTKAITEWLKNHYTSERGKGTFDNPVELARYQESWPANSD